MGSSSKKRQTFAKMTRERMVKERRALKQQKKDAKKFAAAMERDAEAAGIPFSAPEGADGDTETADSTFSAREAEDETRADVARSPLGSGAGAKSED